MLSLNLIVGGKAKSSPEHAMALDYLAKARDMGRKLGLAGFDLTEVDERKLPNMISGLASPVCLDERGASMTSRDFAAWIANVRDRGQPSLNFVIGGADGLSAAARSKIPTHISFGQQTWPHLLVRAMLAEQLYRAMTILANHPYHRD